MSLRSALRHLVVLLTGFALLSAVPVQAQPTPSPRTAAGTTTASGDHVVVLYADGTVTREAFEHLAAAGVPSEDVTLRSNGLVIAEAPAHTTVEAFAAELAGRPDVVAAAPDFEMHLLAIPNDPAYPAAVSSGTGQRTYLGPTTVHPHAINLEPVWTEVFDEGPHSLVPERTGIALAVIDTGVTPSLREETGEFVPVWNYVDGTRDTTDDNGHGTRVASMIRAQTGNGYGIAGVLNTSRNPILVYKTLNASGNGQASWVIEAMLDAASRGARIINLSLGANPSRLTFEQRLLLDAAVRQCREAGSLVVAATGNTAGRGVFYPAASPGALAVGGLDHLGENAGNRWPSSTFGPEVDVVAPASDLWSVNPNDSFSRRAGTSYATPLVSGSAALLWSLVPDVPLTTIEHALISTADGSVGPVEGFDEETGHGRIDVLAAYESLRASIPALPPVPVSVRPLGGFEHELSWSPSGSGTGVFYRYGVTGGQTYTTTGTTARVFVQNDGPSELWVRAFAGDRWRAAPTTVAVEVATGLPPLATERLAGRDRYATSAVVSRTAFPDTADVAVVASGADWPDALAAGPLAHALAGPVLLTQPHRLSVEARDELVRLAPSRVILVGGPRALALDTEAAVRTILPGAEITRLWGSDRFATAARIAEGLASEASPSRRAFVVSGLDWPDALAVSPVAAASSAPIVLTRPDSLPLASAAVIDSLAVTDTVIVGGTRAVSPGVAAALPAPTRVGGTDRYDTARTLATWATDEGVLTGSGLGVASGRVFADALITAPLLAQRSEPLVLGERVTAETTSWLAARDTSSFVFFGGPIAISLSSENALKRAVRGGPVP